MMEMAVPATAAAGAQVVEVAAAQAADRAATVEGAADEAVFQNVTAHHGPAPAKGPGCICFQPAAPSSNE